MVITLTGPTYVTSILTIIIDGTMSLSKTFFVKCNLYRYICLILLEKQFDEV